MMVLPYLHTDGDLHGLEAELRAEAAPMVVARVSTAKGAGAAGRPPPSASAAAATLGAGLALAMLCVGAVLLFPPSVATALPATPSSPPPPPLLLPLPGGAPNCFGNDAACARGLMLPLPLPQQSAAAPQPPPASQPPSSLVDLIPKVIHMTVEDRSRVPCHVTGLMRSWARRNPGWRVWVWDAADRDRLIAESFPRWRAYFAALPNGVERADLFKYAVLSAIGGLYTDIDVECRRPIEEWPGVYALMRQGQGQGQGVGGNGTTSPPPPPLPKSALVLGIEAMHDDAQTYVDAKHVYPLQLSAWTVLSSPGHPALGRPGDALFPASQAEAARELLALFAPGGRGSGAGAGDEKEVGSRLSLLRDVLGVDDAGKSGGGGEERGGGGGGGGGGDFGDYGAAPDADLQDARARLWWRESILNRTGPFLLTRQVLAFASERLEPSLRIGTHEDAARALRNGVGFVGATTGLGAPASSPASSSSSRAAVAILPLDAFGAGQPHSHAGPEDGEGVLAVHRFLSSWRGSGDGKGDRYWCKWTGGLDADEQGEDYA